MKLPGPPALPIIGNGLQFTTNDLCRLFQEFKEIARSYGPIARLWFGPVLIVVLTDPDCIESVVRHDKVVSRGTLIRKALQKVFRNGLVHTDGEEWRRHRKIVSAALHINSLEGFVENFAKNSDILANNLKAVADGITAHDIAPYLMSCTLDIITQTSCRVDLNAQNGNEESTLNSIETVVHTTVVRLTKPWLLIDWILSATELGKKYDKAVKCVHDKIIHGVEEIKRMRENGEKGSKTDEIPSLIDLLIQNADITKKEIVGEMSSVLGAATKTASTACGHVLAFLGDNQHIQERIMQEQQDIFGDDILRPVRSDDLPRMVYLEQVGNCLLRSPLLSRIEAIFLNYIK